ncbi:MAG: glycoside hydrolase family 3 N-terminal domain-containing protein [Motilibacteraceae bacterium]
MAQRRRLHGDGGRGTALRARRRAVLGAGAGGVATLLLLTACGGAPTTVPAGDDSPAVTLGVATPSLSSTPSATATTATPAAATTSPAATVHATVSSTPSHRPTATARPSATSTATTAAPARCTTTPDLSTWSDARLAAQTIIVPVQETSVWKVGPQVAAGAGGVLLFGSYAPSGLRASLDSLAAKAPDGVRPFVMSDEEGGSVQRMANVVGRIPSARAMAATLSRAEVKALGSRTGRLLRGVGVTMDLAPVLDLDDQAGPSNDNPDGTRSFSLDPATASAYGRAFASGLRAGGVVPVVKHFPGLGGSTGNTDVRPATSRPWSTVKEKDLRPFADAVTAGIPAVMVSNASVPGLTTLPASVSREVITGVLRGQLGFGGLVLTDSLSAGALSANGMTVPRATVRALEAGADMVMFGSASSGTGPTMQATVDAVVAAVRSGELPRTRLREAVQHILAAKHGVVC